MAYATVQEVQARMIRTMSESEQGVCSTLLDDAAVIIDAFAPDATDATKGIVSCRMVVRAIGDGTGNGFPIGATQGSMSALGYSQSWSAGNGGANGELYLAKIEKQMLGMGNRIGSHSPVEDIAGRTPSW